MKLQKIKKIADFLSLIAYIFLCCELSATVLPPFDRADLDASIHIKNFAKKGERRRVGASKWWIFEFQCFRKPQMMIRKDLLSIPFDEPFYKVKAWYCLPENHSVHPLKLLWYGLTGVRNSMKWHFSFMGLHSFPYNFLPCDFSATILPPFDRAHLGPLIDVKKLEKKYRGNV